MHSFNWTCPYCNRLQSVTEAQQEIKKIPLLSHWDGVLGPVVALIHSILCANDDCKQLELRFSLHEPKPVIGGIEIGTVIQLWNLLPESSAKPQPHYIPDQIVEDYTEACKIRDLSPKASASLSRRCIQGIIRDFCGIQEATLYKELETLKKQVDSGKAPENVLPEIVDALHDVREIGNIGAHMEKDVNLIIDIEPIEAQALITLIEMLFLEWYVHRHTRQKRLKNLSKISQNKQRAKNKPTTR